MFKSKVQSALRTWARENARDLSFLEDGQNGPGLEQNEEEFNAISAPLVAGQRERPAHSDASQTDDETLRGLMRLGTGAVIAHRLLRAASDARRRSTQDGRGQLSKRSTYIAPKEDLLGVWGVLTSSWINLLLFCIPIGIASHTLKWPPLATFSLNFVGIIPLALILGEITEDLAVRFGDTIGGLINATFGNVVELIIALFALSKDMYDVVAMSMLGSILSNLLLVLGCCFLVGGLRFKVQSFNQMANRATSSLLFLSCIALSTPMVAQLLTGGDRWVLSEKQVLWISRGSALMLAAMYIFYLMFQLWTHKSMFVGEETHDEPAFSLVGATAFLCAVTLAVAFCSEYLTDSLETMTAGGKGPLSRAFLSIILLPIAGNACEHITAVLVAYKDKMDLSLGVAVGSSIQIAVFVLPVSVLAGWAMGKPFSLDSTAFDPFGVLALTAAVVHANFVTNDGQSHWLMGVQLLATYTLIGFVFLFR